MSDDNKVVRLGSKKSKKAAAEAEQAQPIQENNELVYCSFCKRPNTQVIKMVKGPGVNICSECTMIAVQYLILNDRMLSSEAQKILEMFWGRTRP